MTLRACGECGHPLSQLARFCANCGTPIATEPSAPAESAGERSPRVRRPAKSAAARAAALAAGAASDEPPRAPVPPVTIVAPPPVPAAPPARTSGMASAGLILGIMSWFLLFVVIGLVTGFVTAPLSVGMGMAARRQIAEAPETWRGNGMATAGLALGLVWMICATIVVSLLVAARLVA